MLRTTGVTLELMGSLKGLKRGVTVIRFTFWKDRSSYQEQNRGASDHRGGGEARQEAFSQPCWKNGQLPVIGWM